MSTPSSSGRKRHPARTVRYGSVPLSEILRGVAAAEGAGGTSIVFAGGTEDDMQAAVKDLARQVSFNVHEIDAAALVGDQQLQTQGNLREMFDNAGEQASILCFEHADALFSAPDVAARRDKDALTSVDYLFQRMDAYKGIVVLCLQAPDHVARARAHGVDLVVEF